MTAVGGLWLHLPLPSLLEWPQPYLLIGSAVFISIKLLRIIGIVVANISLRGPSIATISQITGDVVEIRVELARSKKFRPGQFIYLNIPRLSLFGFHPFQIAWADQGKNGRQFIVLLVQTRRGFTARLTTEDKRWALIEGPYGQSVAVEQYRTVFFFATGIGIAGQLPFVKKLLELYYDSRAKARNIVLFWEVDYECK